LHFVVKRNAGAKEVSVPLHFVNVARGVFQPRFEELVSSDYAAPATQRAAIHTAPATGASSSR
jgi:hypothetical protein